MCMSNIDSQRILKPVALYDDPFRVTDSGRTRRHKLVLCETLHYALDG